MLHVKDAQSLAALEAADDEPEWQLEKKHAKLSKQNRMQSVAAVGDAGAAGGGDPDCPNNDEAHVELEGTSPEYAGLQDMTRNQLPVALAAAAEAHDAATRAARPRRAHQW